MRTPTPREVAFAWYSNALKGVYGDEIHINPDEPQCGWFKRRMLRGGVYVPARVWLFSPTDPDTGELVGDEVLQCEVDGQIADPYDQWSYLAGSPITEAEFRYLTALRQHAEIHEPDLPHADPRKPVDWLTAPIPAFTPRKDTLHE